MYRRKLVIAGAVLMAGCSLGPGDAAHETVLATSCSRTDQLESLIDDGLSVDHASDGRALVLWATGSSCLDTVEMLIDRNADLSAVDSTGRGIIDHAMADETGTVLEMIIGRREACVPYVPLVDPIDYVGIDYVSAAESVGHDEHYIETLIAVLRECGRP